jgi:hypothetical protein
VFDQKPAGIHQPFYKYTEKSVTICAINGLQTQHLSLNRNIVKTTSIFPEEYFQALCEQ